MTKTSQQALASKQALGVFGAAAIYYVGLSSLLSREIGRTLGQLAVFFDGQVYLSIARSFPLPYSERALDYAGHAPGFPGLGWLIHLITPNSLVNWGDALMMATWLPAAAAVALFFLAAQKLEAKPWLPTLAFAVANPAWVLSATTPHAEPLAVALLLGSLLAHLHGRAGIAGLALGLAVVTRYPSAVLGAWLLFGLLASTEFRPRPKIVHAFWSLAAFGLITLYLYWRIPSFEGISHAHSVFWDTGLIWPFSGLFLGFGSTLWIHPNYEVTYSIFAVYLGAMLAAVWSRDRPNMELFIWLLLTAGAAASFRGLLGLWDYTRLSLPAWPAALLIVARCSREMRSRLAFAAACCVVAIGGAVAVWSVIGEGNGPYRTQPGRFPWLTQEMDELDRDAPRWVDFGKFHREPKTHIHDPNADDAIDAEFVRALEVDSQPEEKGN